jgi:hypothetical protein
VVGDIFAFMSVNQALTHLAAYSVRLRRAFLLLAPAAAATAAVCCSISWISLSANYAADRITFTPWLLSSRPVRSSPFPPAITIDINSLILLFSCQSAIKCTLVHTLIKLELPIISVGGGGKSDFTCERLLRANCVYFWTFCLTWVYLINAALESEAPSAHPPPLHPICGCCYC